MEPLGFYVLVTLRIATALPTARSCYKEQRKGSLPQVRVTYLKFVPIIVYSMKYR